MKEILIVRYENEEKNLNFFKGFIENLFMSSKRNFYGDDFRF